MTLKVLDLFCGAGGAGMGYHRAGFEVVGVDIKVQPDYPFKFIWADATTFPVDGFDLIHASPPCQFYSNGTSLYTKGGYKPLIQQMRERFAGKAYVIENVMGARADLWQPIMLCGAMFNMEISRHRLFEMTHKIEVPAHPYCRGMVKRTAKRRRISPRWATVTGDWEEETVPHWREIMGMDWTWEGFSLKEAIPPVYTEFIGRALRDRLRSA